MAQFRWKLFAALVGLSILLTALTAQWYVWPIYLDQTTSRGLTTLRQSVASMLGMVHQYEKLPELLAQDDLLEQLVQDTDNIYLIDQTNRALYQTNALLGASDIYVLDLRGITIAASNYASDVSFVGDDFSFRPYFQTALKGGRGSYFALGATSLKRGYYFSSPVRVGNIIKGVVVFKVNIETMESAWGGAEQEVIVTDHDGVIFMSSEPEWLFRSLEPLDKATTAEIAASKQYSGISIEPLPAVSRRQDDEETLLSVRRGENVQEFVAVSAPMTETHWIVHVLSDTKAAANQATLVTIALLLAEAVIAGGLVILHHRRTRMSQYLEVQRLAQRELEEKVQSRTADLHEAKTVLEKEVQERIATEQALRQTQSELVQAGKLAAVGHMSAAVSHELSQPLTAIRAYADSAIILVELDRQEEAASTLKRIVAMADRMSKISHQLRSFARIPTGKVRTVELAVALNDAIEIISPRLKEADVELAVHVPSCFLVEAGLVRLAQVFVNILSNAADAVENCEERRVMITARLDCDRVAISFHDSGPGIAADRIKRVFDPFYSTKGTGSSAGLGLGLSISFNVIRDFGGELSVCNHQQGGAVFTVTLPAGLANQPIAAREAIVS
ncbi:sensor histidine kinase [Devosia naphthalenivorans]|uniref:sensor histidine kinase n=1 Tax=Devosia naphthalenivorans TaxID=2082392 RepID=UPI000D3B7165|nr:ATP-binding protein [Devosia naphthalenivorans]